MQLKKKNSFKMYWTFICLLKLCQLSCHITEFVCNLSNIHCKFKLIKVSGGT